MANRIRKMEYSKKRRAIAGPGINKEARMDWMTKLVSADGGFAGVAVPPDSLVVEAFPETRRPGNNLTQANKIRHNLFAMSSHKIIAPSTPINYAAVLADMEAKRAQLDSAIAAITVLMEQTGVMAATSTPLPRIAEISQVPSRAFVGLSISAAVRRLLEMMQRRMSIREIMQGLQAGGLKPSKYRNVYAILRQRESDKADIIKVDRQWGLAEWNPELPPRSNLIGLQKRKL